RRRTSSIHPRPRGGQDANRHPPGPPSTRGSAIRGLRPPHSLEGRGRRGATAMARGPDRGGPVAHGGDRSMLLPLDLFPRARRPPLRDRHRSSRLLRRRDRRLAGRRPQAAEMARVESAEHRAGPPAPKPSRGRGRMSSEGSRVDPHAGQPLLSRGTPLASAKSAMILLHGRGASAQDILELAPALQAPTMAFLAPQAAGHTWYPQSFLSPIESNEPGLSSALALLAAIESRVSEAGIPPEALFLLGFSQGA